jgi:carboxymethylenebutenolidase
MAERVTVTAADGHSFDAWRAAPKSETLGGVVVLHAVFGLTSHMGDVCDSWADEGFAAIAPSLFDRDKPGLVHPYSHDGVEAGSRNYAAIADDRILADIEASRVALAGFGKVAISGFCTGGSWAWTAGDRLAFDAQVNFYGSHVVQRLDQHPGCPTIMHYGDDDFVVPMADIEKIQAANPEVTIFVYPGAGHAFFNPEQVDNYHSEATSLAWRRSLDFLREQFGK